MRIRVAATTLALLTGCPRHAGPIPPPSCADPVILTPTITTYAVSGATWKELEASMAANGPPEAGGWPAYTGYDVDMACATRDGVPTVTLNMTVHVHMPERAHGATGEVDDAAWDTYSAALLAHEQGHVRRTQAALGCLAAEADAAPSCDAVAGLVRGRLDALGKVQADYDDVTDHGRIPDPELATRP
jgi:predicted secreted Zn-dependent protease